MTLNKLFLKWKNSDKACRNQTHSTTFCQNFCIITSILLYEKNSYRLINTKYYGSMNAGLLNHPYIALVITKITEKKKSVVLSL